MVACVSTAHPTPAHLLRALVAADPGRPRITVYDDTDSATRGERIELSARVLANWVAKGANLLRDDLDVGGGSVVRLDLPPHWRTLYWALATWSVGAAVDVPARRRSDAGGAAAAADSGDAGGDVVVTDAVDVASAATASGADVVFVTLAALARSATVPVPAGAVDEARELATHGDVFDAWDEPDPSDVALRLLGDGETTYAAVVPEAVARGERVHTSTADTAAFLRLALEVWAGDGSLVLSRGDAGADVLTSRFVAEGVTRRS